MINDQSIACTRFQTGIHCIYLFFKTTIKCMKPVHLFFAGIALLNILTCSCNNSGKNETVTSGSTTKPTVADDGIVPKIDTANLKDETSILSAMSTVLEARKTDDNKSETDKSYKGHYSEFTMLYTAVLKAGNAYMATLKDPAKALEFNEKLSKITDKYYAK
jgi:hypothetical protein